MTGLLFESIMTWDSIKELAFKVRAGDALECVSMGVTPLQALTSGVMFSNATGVYRHSDNACIGAYGWTEAGTIWSLWAPLTKRESLEVLRATPDRVARMVKASGKAYLSNWVATSNKPAVKWLKASKSFGIDPYPRVIGKEVHNYFETLPPFMFPPSPMVQEPAYV